MRGEGGQGSTIGICRVRTYAYFYWHTHGFGYAYVETYAHFFLMTFPLLVLGRDRFFTVFQFFIQTIL